MQLALQVPAKRGCDRKLFRQDRLSAPCLQRNPAPRDSSLAPDSQGNGGGREGRDAVKNLRKTGKSRQVWTSNAISPNVPRVIEILPGVTLSLRMESS